MSERPSDDLESLRATTDKVMATIAGIANVEAAFGPSRVVGDHTIIPVAEVVGGLGSGMGGGRDQTGASGGGAGSGGGVTVRPIATVVVGPEGVTVKPVYDLTKIWLAALTTAAFALLWTARLSRVAAAARKMESNPAKALKGVRQALR
jgi:uncharacterized spore protein YtfJ